MNNVAGFNEKEKIIKGNTEAINRNWKKSSASKCRQTYITKR